MVTFVEFGNGKNPTLHAFINEEGRPLSVKRLKDTVRQAFRSIDTRKQMWWMQDGAICDYIMFCIELLYIFFNCV